MSHLNHRRNGFSVALAPFFFEVWEGVLFGVCSEIWKQLQAEFCLGLWCQLAQHSGSGAERTDNARPFGYCSVPCMACPQTLKSLLLFQLPLCFCHCKTGSFSHLVHCRQAKGFGIPKSQCLNIPSGLFIRSMFRAHHEQSSTIALTKQSSAYKKLVDTL